MGAQDFTIAYPTNVNVATPDDYTTSEAINSLFQNIGGGSYTINGGGSVIDCDSETSDCIIEDTDSLDGLDSLDDLKDFDWIWDDDED
jgi:hypothetical protein